MSTDEQIRQVLTDHGGLAIASSGLSPGADLYRNGLTSHASVSVMLALEDTFDVEFPDRMIRRATFASIDTISSALAELGVDTRS